MTLEEMLNSILSPESDYKAPLIYPQEQREMMQSNYPALGKQSQKKDTKMSKEEAVLTGLMAGLGTVAPLLGRRRNDIVAPARATSGKSFPFQIQQLAQYPGGIKSVLARYMLGG